MARPLWSGTIQIALVGFAVDIYPATSTTRPISFHEIDRNTLGRVRRENVSAGPSVAAESVEPETSAETGITAAKHSSSLHLAPQARDIGAARGVEESPVEHTV